MRLCTKGHNTQKNATQVLDEAFVSGVRVAPIRPLRPTQLRMCPSDSFRPRPGRQCGHIPTLHWLKQNSDETVSGCGRPAQAVVRRNVFNTVQTHPLCVQSEGVFLTSCSLSLLRYTSPDFLYIRSWLPCIFFAGVITMGNIGRQLALVRPGIRPETGPGGGFGPSDAVCSVFQYEYKFVQEKTHQD